MSNESSHLGEQVAAAATATAKQVGHDGHVDIKGCRRVSCKVKIHFDLVVRASISSLRSSAFSPQSYKASIS